MLTYYDRQNQDPFPSQYSDNFQPPAVMVDDHEEWVVEQIVNEHRTRQGRGWRVQYEVKWLGYAETNWELVSALEETTALDEWLARTEPYRRPDGTLDNLQMANSGNLSTTLHPGGDRTWKTCFGKVLR